MPPTSEARAADARALEPARAGPLVDPSTYPTAVRSDSPVGHWRLDSLDGTEPDTTANGNTATRSAQVVTRQVGALAAEVPDLETKFDGLLNSARLEISASLAVNPTASTIEGWVNPGRAHSRMLQPSLAPLCTADRPAGIAFASCARSFEAEIDRPSARPRLLGET